MSRSPVSEFGPRGGWYASYRTIHVVSNLESLRGPTTGSVQLPLHLDASARVVVQLPLHLDASARVVYDLAKTRRRDRMYEVVIVEGGTDEDFAAWLDRDALIAAWPRLYLPRPVRAAWEARHPELAARGAGPDVPPA